MNKVKVLICVFSLFFLTIGCKGQTTANEGANGWIPLRMEKKQGRITLFPLDAIWKEKDYPIGVPNKITLPEFFQISFSFAMSRYNMMKDGDLDSTSFYNLNYDTKRYGDTQHHFLMKGVSGWKGDDHIMVLDQNYNNDVSDDPLYVFNKTNIQSNQADTVINIVYQNIIGDSIHAVKTALYFKDRSSVMNDTIINKSIDFGYYNNLTADFKFCNEPLNLLLSDWTQDQELYSTVNVNYKNETFTMNKGDVIKFNDCYLSLDSIDFTDRKILISNSKKPKLFPHLKSVSLYNSDTLSTKQHVKKYTLVHFWGSWCAPCVQNLPTLVNFDVKKQYENVIFKGICVDNKRENAIKTANELKLQWDQLYFTNQQLAHEFSERIITYPTYMVVDSSDHIVFKTLKMDALEEFLNKLDN